MKLNLLFDHHDSVMVHTTSVTATTGMLSGSANSTSAHGHVTTHASSFLQSCYLHTRKGVNTLEYIVHDSHGCDSLTIFLFADRFNNK